MEEDIVMGTLSTPRQPVEHHRQCTYPSLPVRADHPRADGVRVPIQCDTIDSLWLCSHRYVCPAPRADGAVLDRAERRGRFGAGWVSDRVSWRSWLPATGGTRRSLFPCCGAECLRFSGRYGLPSFLSARS